MKKIFPFLFLFLACEEKRRSTFADGKIKFFSINKIPVIEGTLNGKKCYFIIDSGASISVLDEKQSEEFGFQLTDENSGQEVAGYGGNGELSPVEGEFIEIGGVSFNGEYYSQDISNIVRVIESVDGIKLVGIIGSNILKEKKAIIDFGDSSLSIK